MAPVLMSSIYQPLIEYVESAKYRVTLVSPFLSIPIAISLAKIAESSSASWTLLTHLDINSVASGYLSIDGLRKLQGAGVSIRHLDRLHAKAYVMDDVVFVGSGNLTGAGLGLPESKATNTELNYYFSNNESSETISAVEKWLGNAIEVTPKTLNEVEAEAKWIITKRVSRSKPRTTKATAIADRNFWVKLHYGSADWDIWRKRAWFSNGKRASIKQGDLILIAAQEDAAVHAIVQATSDVREDPDVLLSEGYSEEDAFRWRWVTNTKPWSVPAEGTLLSYKELGINGRSLQNGYKRLGVAEFSKAAEYFEEHSND